MKTFKGSGFTIDGNLVPWSEKNEVPSFIERRNRIIIRTLGVYEFKGTQFEKLEINGHEFNADGLPIIAVSKNCTINYVDLQRNLATSSCELVGIPSNLRMRDIQFLQEDNDCRELKKELHRQGSTIDPKRPPSEGSVGELIRFANSNCSKSREIFESFDGDHINYDIDPVCLNVKEKLEKSNRSIAEHAGNWR